jgi:opacity protein-like surface antigen
VKKLLLAAGFLAAATSAAFAQAYGNWNAPYGYGPGYYNYGVPYVPPPYAAAQGFYGFYGFDPTANNWDYYRVDQPGRGNNVESTR